MKAVLPILLIGFLVAAGAIYVLDPFSDRNADYRAENERIAALLTHPVDGKLLTSEQKAYFDEGFSSILNRAKGWMLNITYQAPIGASAEDISAFYESHAPTGWKVESATVTSVDTAGKPGPSYRDVFYSEGSVRVTIATQGMIEGGAGTYIVSIDHKSGSGSTEPSAQR